MNNKRQKNKETNKQTNFDEGLLPDVSILVFMVIPEPSKSSSESIGKEPGVPDALLTPVLRGGVITIGVRRISKDVIESISKRSNVTDFSSRTLLNSCPTIPCKCSSEPRTFSY